MDRRCRYFPLPQPRSTPILPEGKVERKAGIKGHGYPLKKKKKRKVRKRRCEDRGAESAHLVSGMREMRSYLLIYSAIEKTDD